MSQRIHAIYDGSVLRPETEIDLEPNTRYLLTVEKDERDELVRLDAPYPLTLIKNVATDMGVTDLAENHDLYAHTKLAH